MKNFTMEEIKKNLAEEFAPWKVLEVNIIANEYFVKLKQGEEEKTVWIEMSPKERKWLRNETAKHHS